MFCNKTKEFLSQNGIEFTERDITTDQGALEELQTRGLMTTPVTVIDGEAVVGFDKNRLSAILNLR